jgi:hypothetical protein
MQPVHAALGHPHQPRSRPPDPNQKGFYGRSIKRLDALLDRSSADPLALAGGLGTRLSGPQREALHLNRALLYLLSGKADAARDLAGHLAKAYPNSPLVAMLQAVLLARSGKVRRRARGRRTEEQEGRAAAGALRRPLAPCAGGRGLDAILTLGPAAASTDPLSPQAADADKLLAGLAAKGGDAALAPQLLRAQLALEDANLAGALERLKELHGGAADAPGVVATRVSLLEQVHRRCMGGRGAGAPGVGGRASNGGAPKGDRPLPFGSTLSRLTRPAPQLGDTAGAEALLDAALSRWQAAARADPRDAAAAEAVGWCLQRAVALKLQLDKAAEATQLYLQQQQGGGGKRGKGGGGGSGGAADAAVLAQLARAAAAAGDLATVAVLGQQLPGGVEAAGRGLDPEALEDLTRALASVRTQRRREAEAAAEAAVSAADGAGGKRRRGGDAPGGEGARKKKKRKPRYPKGYDPSKPNGGLPPPDPERWLPKWQRSDYKKKQKRRRDRTEGPVKGSQGAGKVDESLDRAKKGAEPMEVDAKGKGPASRPALPQRKGGKK